MAPHHQAQKEAPAAQPPVRRLMAPGGRHRSGLPTKNLPAKEANADPIKGHSGISPKGLNAEAGSVRSVINLKDMNADPAHAHSAINRKGLNADLGSVHSVVIAKDLNAEPINARMAIKLNGLNAVLTSSHLATSHLRPAGNPIPAKATAARRENGRHL